MSHDRRRRSSSTQIIQHMFGSLDLQNCQHFCNSFDILPTEFRLRLTEFAANNDH